MSDIVINLLLTKYSLKEDTWLRLPTKSFVGIQAYEYFYSILNTNNLKDASEILNCSYITLSRISKELNGGSTFSKGGGSLNYYFGKEVGYYSCDSCNKFLPNSDFHESKKTRCKRCRSVSFREYYKENSSEIKFRTTLRHNHIAVATPKWANLEKIKEIYSNCPEGFHVDHILPLQGELICGLHVENNLQYLTAEANLKKGNKYTPA